MEYRDKLQKLGITLTKSGKQTCPNCSHLRKNKSEPCLSVTYTDDAVLYKCHNGCGFEGVVYYRSKYEKRKRTYKKPEQPKVAKEQNPLYRYFEKRCISKGTLDKYGVTFTPDKKIALPYYKYGELVNVKYRTNLGNGKKTFIQVKDTEKTLFGMDLVKDTDTLIWVEGEMDVLAFAEQGISSVSIPNGANDKQFEFFENCFDFIQQFKTHIIAVDNDIQGDKLKETLLNRIGKTKCKVVDWKQYKDANEALIGGEKLADFVDNAQDIAPDGIITFMDSINEIYSYNFEKDQNFYESGWESLDKLVKLRTGYLMIVTGYPSRGKSTFVDNLLINLSEKYNIRHLIASFESTTAGHFNSLLEMYKKEPIYKFIREKGKDEIFGEPFSFLDEHFYRFDVDRMWSVDEIIERTELAIRKYGIKTLVIDPYNRLNNKITNGREDLYIGSILSKLSMLAKRLDILVIFVAHPRKPDGEKMPNMFSISGSGDWYNMADYGIVVHRDRKEDGKLSNLPTIMVEKVKNHFLGNPSGGCFTLMYVSTERILKDVA